MNSSKENVEKIDVEDLIKDFKVLNIDTFAGYLKEVWRVIHYFKILGFSSEE
jgi:hypothetical protein